MVCVSAAAAVSLCVCADGELLCRSAWSERSGGAVSRCRRGEEMMGCGSYSPDGVGAGATIGVSPSDLPPPQHDRDSYQTRHLCVHR